MGHLKIVLHLNRIEYLELCWNEILLLRQNDGLLIFVMS